MGLFGLQKQEAMDSGIKAALTMDSAEDFLKRFLESRRDRLVLEKVILYNGEKLRRFPQRSPPYATSEKYKAQAFEICFPKGPGGEPFIRKLDTPAERHTKMVHRSFERLHSPVRPRKRSKRHPLQPPFPSEM